MQQISPKQLAFYVQGNKMLPQYFQEIILMKIKDKKYSQLWLSTMYREVKFLEKFIS